MFAFKLSYLFPCFCLHILLCIAESIMTNSTSLSSQLKYHVWKDQPEIRYANDTNVGHLSNLYSNLYFPEISSAESPLERQGLGIIFSTLVIGLLVIVAAVVLLIQWYMTNQIKAQPLPEEQIQLQHCQEENALFEYKFVFRVGCPTALFDMKHGWIEMQLIEQNNVPIGIPIRYVLCCKGLKY